MRKQTSKSELTTFVAATDWVIQAGGLDMFATADAKKAFMVGGTGNDNEWRLAA